MSAASTAGRRAKTNGESPRPRVCILSTRRQTLDELEAYLNLAGIATSCRRSVADFRTVTRTDVTAAVIFPDEFADDAITSLVRALSASLRDALVVIVTEAPKRYEAVRQSVTVLPKPSFAWDILDAVRAHATARRGSD